MMCTPCQGQFGFLVFQSNRYLCYTNGALPQGRTGQRWGATRAPVWVYKGGDAYQHRFFLLQTSTASLETKAKNLGVHPSREWFASILLVWQILSHLKKPLRLIVHYRSYPYPKRSSPEIRCWSSSSRARSGCTKAVWDQVWVEIPAHGFLWKM